MIGNDVIDLTFAKRHSRWQEQRFLDKLFSTNEQLFILSDGNRFQNIWRLWSMKESAYKIISRAEGIVRFNPKDFECSITNATDGNVFYESMRWSTFTETHLEYLQTVAFINQNWTAETLSINDSDIKFQHRELYHHAVKGYGKLKNVSTETIEIRKNTSDVPAFYNQGILQKDHLSLSHHGYFVAWAIADDQS